MDFLLWTTMDFLWKTVIIQWKTRKIDSTIFATKLTEKIPDSRNSKEHYRSFIRNEITKSVKQSKIITQQQKVFENPNILYIKSVITEHTKTSHKLSKTIRQIEKISQVGSNSSLYSDTRKAKNFLMKKM